MVRGGENPPDRRLGGEIFVYLRKKLSDSLAQVQDTHTQLLLWNLFSFVFVVFCERACAGARLQSTLSDVHF